MNHNELTVKAQQVFVAAGEIIEHIEHRHDSPQGVSCDLVTAANAEGVRDYFNLTIPFDGDIVWHDFSHTTPLGDSKDTQEALAQRLRSILAAYQPELVGTVDDLNNLVKPYPLHAGYDDCGHSVQVVVQRRKDKSCPKLEKVVDEKFHLFNEDAEQAHKEITEKVGDYYEVRTVVVYFCPLSTPTK